MPVVGLPGRKVTAEEMKCVNLYPEKFHGEWNYVIKPNPARQRSTN
jgi:hypothetical protein